MGKTLMGSSGTQDLLRPEQLNYLTQALQGGGAYGQFLQPQDYEQLFQEKIVAPATRAYEQQVVPGLQQRFVDVGAGSSSALNQALAQSAQDLTSSLSGKYMDFLQGQQGNTLQALQQLSGLSTASTMQPYQQEGLLPGIIQAAGALAGGSLAGGGTAGIGPLMALIRKIIGR